MGSHQRQTEPTSATRPFHKLRFCSQSSTTTTTITAMSLVIFITLMSLVAPTIGYAKCPTGCQCDDDTLIVNCGEGTLDVLPITLNPSIKRLVIKSNKIKTIDSSMQFYTELTFLDLSYNDLVTIPQHTFNYQKKLQELHLNHNKIGQISGTTFRGLQAVTVLNLRGNLIAELEKNTFASMEKIEELNLGQNRISRIDAHAFDGLKNLRVLYLDDNTLTAVPEPITFKAMPSLAELYLGTNSFMSIPAGAFQDLKGLTRLDLRSAGLQNISAASVKGLESVRVLDLADNRLQYIPTAAFANLTRLEELSIGQNDFEVIAAGAFAGLKNLRRLEITGAQRLRRVESGAFSPNTNLEYLNLSSNKQLNELQTNALGGLPHLRHVILKENQLSTLNEGLIPWADLDSLDLSENPIVCDCQVLWLRDLLIRKNATNEQFVSVICAYPGSLREQSLSKLSPTVLGCAHSAINQQTLVGGLLVVTAAAITALALIIYTCRRRIRELLKGRWGNSALGRKEREYQKTFSDEEYMTRPAHGCGGVHPSAPYPCNSYNPHQAQYMGTRPIPVTEL